MKNPCSPTPADLLENGARYIRMVYSANDWWFPLWELHEILGLLGCPVSLELKPEWRSCKVFPSLFGEEELSAVCSEGAYRLAAASDSREADLLMRWLSEHSSAGRSGGLLLGSQAQTVLPVLPDEHRHWKLVKKDLSDISMRFKRTRNYISFCCRTGGVWKNAEKLAKVNRNIDQAALCLQEGEAYLNKASGMIHELNEV